MKRILLLLAGLLLCPAMAGAQAGYYPHDFETEGYWLGVGLGGGAVKSTAPAPSAGRDAFGASVDAGVRITPEWGLGIEYGVVAPGGGCGGHHCTPASPDFAPDFTRWFLVGEYRPPGADRGWRLRAGVGVSNMCYRHYRTTQSAWERFLEALLFDDYDDDYDTDRTYWSCKSLSALGGAVSLGYQWELEDTHSSIGLQLRAEGANFAASSKAGTPAFRHRAVMLQVQFNIN
jgi:hypothetical protein